eukprot:2584287-Heterocapsa_arctica.AAC.1
MSSALAGGYGSGRPERVVLTLGYSCRRYPSAGSQSFFSMITLMSALRRRTPERHLCSPSRSA